MIELYSHQVKFMNALLDGFKRWKHLIGYAPCSFGKSYVIASIAERSVKKGKKVLILTHRLILLRQNNNSLLDFSLGMITINDHSKNMPTDHSLYCSTLQTIQSRLRKDEFNTFIRSFDLICIDEAHDQSSNFLFDSGLIDDIYVIGFTGSPKRDGNMTQLGMYYDEIILSSTIQELIGMEKITPCRYFEIPMDTSDLKIDSLTGDFTGKSQYQKFDSPKVYNGMIHNYKKYAEGRSFVCFCSNISHAIRTCLQFIDNGIPCKFVVSSLSKPKKPEGNGGEYERYLDHLESYELLEQNKHLLLPQSEVNKEFDSGGIQGIISLSILTVGWDYKKLSCLILCRATQSIPLLIQMYGRVVRPYPGKKDSIVIDMGSNAMRIGTAEQERVWSLWHETNSSVGIPAEKICEGKDKNGRIGCGRSVLASLSICKCGFRFATEKEMREVELVERLSDEPTNLKEMSVEGLKAFAELKGYKKTWIWRQLWIRGESEFRNGMRELNYDNKFIYRLQQQYRK